MNIANIRSIELDRTKPFKHEILIKDDTGFIMERIPVTEVAGWEKLNEVYQAWCNHPDYKGL